MVTIEKAKPAREVEAADPFRWFGDWFDMPDLMRWFESRRPAFVFPARLRVEEEMKEGMLVIRVELPGIDPDKDVTLELGDGMLRIKAERTRKTEEEKEGTFHSEFAYGSFTRTVAVPRDVRPELVVASYKDGILEVKVPLPAKVAEPTRIPVTR
jgi:HSP20 family protein